MTDRVGNLLAEEIRKAGPKGVTLWEGHCIEFRLMNEEIDRLRNENNRLTTKLRLMRIEMELAASLLSGEYRK